MLSCLSQRRRDWQSAKDLLGIVRCEEQLRRRCVTAVAREAAARWDGGFAGNPIAWKLWERTWNELTGANAVLTWPSQTPPLTAPRRVDVAEQCEVEWNELVTLAEQEEVVCLPVPCALRPAPALVPLRKSVWLWLWLCL